MHRGPLVRLAAFLRPLDEHARDAGDLPLQTAIAALQEGYRNRPALLVSALAAAQPTEPDLAEQLYYLRSIARCLQALRGMMEDGPTLGTELVANNADWLDCFIEQIEARYDALRAASTDQALRGEA